MGNLKPAANIVFGFIGGLIAWAAVHYVKGLGYDVPADMASALPGANALILAHLWDYLSGDNKK